MFIFPTKKIWKRYRVTPNRSVVLNALINHCSPLLTQSIIECIYHYFLSVNLGDSSTIKMYVLSRQIHRSIFSTIRFFFLFLVLLFLTQREVNFFCSSFFLICFWVFRLKTKLIWCRVDHVTLILSKVSVGFELSFFSEQNFIFFIFVCLLALSWSVWLVLLFFSVCELYISLCPMVLSIIRNQKRITSVKKLWHSIVYVR